MIRRSPDLFGPGREAPHPSIQVAVPWVVTLMGPCRYSIAGYASVQAQAGLAHLQPRLVRETHGPAAPQEGELRAVDEPFGQLGRECRAGVDHNGVGVQAEVGAEGSGRWWRNRVWTTERSSAKSRTTRSSAAVMTGVCGSAVIAVVRGAPLQLPRAVRALRWWCRSG
ncbi:hypothetical protein SALBM311S_07572 [Streptomyces alboniger]